MYLLNNRGQLLFSLLGASNRFPLEDGERGVGRPDWVMLALRLQMRPLGRGSRAGAGVFVRSPLAAIAVSGGETG
jgi:hypothetical protein